MTTPPDHRPKRPFKELAEGGLFTLINYACAFVTGMALARWLGPAGYGDYAVGVAMATFMSAPITLGLQKLALKNLPVYRRDGDWASYRGFMASSYGLILGFGLVLSLAMWAGHELVVSGLGLERHAVIVAAFFAAPVVGLGVFCVEFLNANRAFFFGTGIRMVLHPLLLLALLAGAHWIATTFDAKLAFWCFIAAAAIALLLAAARGFGITAREVWRARPRYRLGHWLGLSLPFMLNSFVVRSIRRTGILLLEFFSPLEGQVGLYAAAAIIASFVPMLSQMSNSYFLPRISPLLKDGDRAGVERYLRRRFLALGSLLAVFCLAMAVWGADILGWFHPEFRPGHAVLVVFCLGASLTALLSVAPLIMQFLGHNREMVKLYAAALIGTVLLTALLCPWLHAMGAVLGFVIPFGVMLGWAGRMLYRDHGLRVIPWPGGRGALPTAMKNPEDGSSGS